MAVVRRVILANGRMRHAGAYELLLEGKQFSGGEAEDDGESSGWKSTGAGLARGVDNLCGENAARQVATNGYVVAEGRRLTVKRS